MTNGQPTNTQTIHTLSEDTITHLCQKIQNGGVFAYPTESVWGLGCDPYNEQAFNKILRLKQRPIEKGVILLAGDITQIQAWLAHLPQDTQSTIIASWNDNSNTEQAVTWLIPLEYENTPLSPTIPQWITGNHRSIAVRVTKHPLVQQLCAQINGTIVSTSCNPAGLAPAVDYAQAYSYFGEQISYADTETLNYSKPSTIIDALTGEVLR